MTQRFAAALLLLALAPLSAADPTPLEGVWVSQSGQRDGKPAPDIKGHVLTFKGDTFSIVLKETLLYSGTFKLDPAAKPSAIDFTHTAGSDKGKVWKGIYSVDQDMLKICDNARDLTKPRPTEMASSSGYVCVTFQRGK